MTLPPCPACGQPPVWWPAGEPRGRYQHQCPSGDWAVTSGPQGEETAAEEWRHWFGAKP